jgi:hypothetical protein
MHGGYELAHRRAIGLCSGGFVRLPEFQNSAVSQLIKAGGSKEFAVGKTPGFAPFFAYPVIADDTVSGVADPLFGLVSPDGYFEASVPDYIARHSRNLNWHLAVTFPNLGNAD